MARDFLDVEGVYLKVDGEPVPASELQWEKTAPCGCACAWTTVRMDCMTESQAWLSLSSDSARMVKRDKARGFTLALIRGKNSRIREGICAHEPRWGVQPRPTPDGHTWAVSTTRKSKAIHLAPLAIEKGSESVWGEETASLCGKSSGWQWSTKWYHLDGLIECEQCWRKAVA